jgi:hypothetical protein
VPLHKAMGRQCQLRDTTSFPRRRGLRYAGLGLTTPFPPQGPRVPPIPVIRGPGGSYRCGGGAARLRTHLRLKRRAAGSYGPPLKRAHGPPVQPHSLGDVLTCLPPQRSCSCPWTRRCPGSLGRARGTASSPVRGWGKRDRSIQYQGHTPAAHFRSAAMFSSQHGPINKSASLTATQDSTLSRPRRRNRLPPQTT